MKNIFITGVSGFVGSSLVHFFDGDNSVKVYAHSRNRVVTEQQYKNIEIQLVDTYSAEVFDSLRIDCVIHLAGIAHDLSNRYVDADYFEVNNKGTRKIYDDFLKSNATKFIYLSSIKAVIDSYPDPVDETIAPHPSTAYGKSKLLAEEYIQEQPLPSGKDFYILRPCMIHGPNNKGNLNLLYKFVKMGIPYPFGAFNNKRSFLSSDNFNFIMNKIVKDPIKSGIYHLADSEPLPTSEVITIIALALNIKPRIWNLSPSFMKFVFNIYGKRILNKLTETMIVSNGKIIDAIHASLPCTSQQGLTKTIHAFHE